MNGRAQEQVPATQAVTPEVGVAGLLTEAAKTRGSYTEIERDRASASLMKLLMLPRPKAKTLCDAAQEAHAAHVTLAGFADAAASLPGDEREQLVRQVWALLDDEEGEASPEREVLSAIGSAFDLSREQILSLRPSG